MLQEGQSGAAPKDIPKDAPPPDPTPSRRPRHRRKKIGQTLYLDPRVHDKIEEILASRKGELSPYTGRRLRKHDLFLQALDLLFEQTGEGSIESLREE